MKASIGLCTWRPLAGVAMVGALAFAVSVQGSPRVGGEREKGQGKSQASRVVTGPGAHINSAIAAGPTATITMQPVAPKTVPASSYPAGSTIVAQTLTLSSVPPGGQRVWIVLQNTAWAPQSLKTVQATLDSNTLLGSNAVCGAGPGGADLDIAQIPCNANTDCRTTTSGITSACGVGEPSSCKTTGGPNFPWFPAGKFCEPGFQDKCDAAWSFAGVPVTAAVDYSTKNIRWGGTTDPGETPPDFAPSYFGTLVLNVPAGAKGTYALGYVAGGTFMQELVPPDTLPIPLAATTGATIVIPCGKCCYGIGTGSGGCVDGLSKAECDLQPAVAIFGQGEVCTNPPTDDGCCACLTNADCNDSDACTQDICTSCVCSHAPVATWNQATECCNATDGSEDLIASPDQCVAAACSLPGNRGDLVLTPRTGLGCDDNNPCTILDTCAGGAGTCAGTDINTISCGTSADCPNGLPCEGGFCKCTLTPDLTIVIDVGGKGFDPECYNDNEKITGVVHVAAATSPINGGQFALTYDPTCLEFNSITGVAPYGVVYGPVVNEGAGSIFIAVGMAFGAGNGPPGQADMLAFSFNKIGVCNQCDICFTDVNPLHTYLTDHEGQKVGVQMNCSGNIKANNDVELTIPGPVINTNVDCDRQTAIETWDAPSVTDTCGTSTIECVGAHENGLVYDQNTIWHGGEFPVGASTFCCQATSDWCGKVVGCLDPTDVNCALSPVTGKADGCWTVNVNDETSLDITVGLSPTSQSKPGANLTRCIKFTLFSNCIEQPLEFCEDVTFGGIYDFVGKSTPKIKVPGSGQWDCITAQDKLHTLRSCYTFAADGSDCVGGQLRASFSGDPRLGGNWLIGGNLDGWKKCDPNSDPSMDVIDILDYGTFLAQYGQDYGSGDTPCGGQFKTSGCCPAEANADINGDGVANLDDYAFVSMNFLTSSKQCCCGPQVAGATAITEISVAQLRAMDLAELAVADLNGDGVLNLADMAAFEQGARPAKATPTKGGTRSSGSR